MRSSIDKKTEAIHRMKMQYICSETAQQLIDEDKIGVYDSPFDVFFRKKSNTFRTLERRINAIFNKHKDPTIILDPLLFGLRKTLVRAQKESTRILTDEKKVSRQVKKCEMNITKYTNAVQNALWAGREGDARKLLSKKRALEVDLVELRSLYDAAHQDTVQIQRLSERLISDIERLKDRKDCASSISANNLI